MGANRLDRVSRVLAGGLSRRQALRQLGAVMVAGGAVLAEPEIASAAGPAKCAKGTISCCVSASIDPNNCGACGHVCSFPNAAASCVSGTCQLGPCHSGFANCNGVASDGCEVNVNTDPSNCGSCGHVCSSTNASSVSCTGGTCSYTCAAGFANCSGNGCTTDLTTDVNNCGTCGSVCSSPNASSASCTKGVCSYTCNAGFANCSVNPANGCTTNLNTDVNNCGTCGTKCTPGQACVNGSCTGTNLPNGTACTSASQCSSGACVPSATNPSSSICCAAACTASAPGSCGTNGFCAADGTCQLAVSGSPCGSGPSCSGNAFTPGQTCDGTGTCATPAPITCSGTTPFCNVTFGGCVQCMSNSDCPPPQMCLTGMCM